MENDKMNEKNYFKDIYWYLMVPKKIRYMLYQIAKNENCTPEEIYFRIIQIHHKQIFEYIEETFKNIKSK